MNTLNKITTLENIGTPLLATLKAHVIKNYESNYHSLLSHEDIAIQYIQYGDHGITINYLTPLSSHLKTDVVPFRVINGTTKDFNRYWATRNS